jgi:hypothetical protein
MCADERSCLKQTCDAGREEEVNKIHISNTSKFIGKEPITLLFFDKLERNKLCSSFRLLRIPLWLTPVQHGFHEFSGGFSL